MNESTEEIGNGPADEEQRSPGANDAAADAGAESPEEGDAAMADAEEAVVDSDED